MLFYFIGVAASLIIIGLGAARIWWWQRTGTLLKSGMIVSLADHYRSEFVIRRKVRGIEHPQVVVPFTAGIWKPIFFIPVEYDEGLSNSQISSVIGHECAHIKRQDVSTLTFAVVVRSLMWIHPFIWLVLRQIAILAEQSADAYVLDTGFNPDNYATTLTDIVRNHVFQQQNIFSSVGFMDYKHSFLHRIRAILQYSRYGSMSRKGYIMLSGFVIITACFVAALPLTKQYAVAKGTSEDTMTLHLVVKDAASKKPIVGLEIIANQWNYKRPKKDPGNLEWEYVDTSTTDTNGEIALNGLRKELVNLIIMDTEFGRKWTKPNISGGKKTKRQPEAG